MTETDHVLADGRWEFDEEVTRVFDDMLARSIPQYQTMRGLVSDLTWSTVSKPLLLGRPAVVADLGSSRGETIASILASDTGRAFGIDPALRWEGYEVSEPMLEAARERFADRTDVTIMRHDLRDGFHRLGGVGFTVVTSILTLMFVPIEYRLSLLADIRKALVPGGRLILVEKVLGASAEIDSLLVSVYYDWKRRAGYTDEEIERKRLSLEGVLVPLPATTTEDLLRRSGFSEVDVFWRTLNFCGWIAS